ncbi:protein LEAD-SENSITIVE 1-like [Silene latifolia]|uniref:protein LEAD-SENSITIVE 1-like n=1 Tax=Silene latifolia TaxID=37657 RepID=UPI003D77C2CB
MGLVRHKVRKEDIKPGDHIYAWRACYTYSHHGIYVGGNKVVHFTAPAVPEDGGLKLSTSSSQSSASYGCPSQCSTSSYGGSNLSTSSSQLSASYGCPSPCPTSSYSGSNISTPSSHSSASYGHPSPCPTYPDCGFRQPDSGVVLSCVDCFLGKGSPHLFEYGVSKLSLHIKRAGTCTTAQADPSETVIHRATYLLQNGFGNYDTFRNNCEDFAIYCKTGLVNKFGFGRSGQAASVNGVSLLATLAGVMRSPLGVAVGAGIYFMTRHESDIGLCHHAIKVPVEELAVYFIRRR